MGKAEACDAPVALWVTMSVAGGTMTAKSVTANGPGLSLKFASPFAVPVRVTVGSVSVGKFALGVFGLEYVVEVAPSGVDVGFTVPHDEQARDQLTEVSAKPATVPVKVVLWPTSIAAAGLGATTIVTTCKVKFLVWVTGAAELS